MISNWKYLHCECPETFGYARNARWMRRKVHSSVITKGKTGNEKTEE
jgi:hypothetical protein